MWERRSRLRPASVSIFPRSAHLRERAGHATDDPLVPARFLSSSRGGVRKGLCFSRSTAGSRSECMTEERPDPTLADLSESSGVFPAAESDSPSSSEIESPAKPAKSRSHSGTAAVGSDRSSARGSSATAVAEEPGSSRIDRSSGRGATAGPDLDYQEILRELMHALNSARQGDFSVRLPDDWTGLEGKIADAFNDIVSSNQNIASELERVGRVVGREGKTRNRTHFSRSQGAWREMERSVNTLIEDLLFPTTEVTRVISAVAQGDLMQTVRFDVDGRPLEGEFLRSATIVNTMIQQLGVFTSEVTRVAREVGTGGK